MSKTYGHANSVDPNQAAQLTEQRNILAVLHPQTDLISAGFRSSSLSGLEYSMA